MERVGLGQEFGNQGVGAGPQSVEAVARRPLARACGLTQALGWCRTGSGRRCAEGRAMEVREFAPGVVPSRPSVSVNEHLAVVHGGQRCVDGGEEVERECCAACWRLWAGPQG